MTRTFKDKRYFGTVNIVLSNNHQPTACRSIWPCHCFSFYAFHLSFWLAKIAEGYQRHSGSFSLVPQPGKYLQVDIITPIPMVEAC
jgi:hypothetical protein